jgi:hypothetical protein
VADLCEALARLVAVANAARTDSGLVEAAFKDRDAAGNSALLAYVDEMRLKLVVQRIWMSDLAAQLDLGLHWQRAIGETRGQALLNIQATLPEAPGFLIGLQLQNRALKAFCMPVPYPTRATTEQHGHVEGFLEKMKKAFALGSEANASSSKMRGFRSFAVHTMPPGRNGHDWAAAVQAKFALLAADFQI